MQYYSSFNKLKNIRGTNFSKNPSFVKNYFLHNQVPV